jgi:hypothetical protein
MPSIAQENLDSLHLHLPIEPVLARAQLQFQVVEELQILAEVGVF